MDAAIIFLKLKSILAQYESTLSVVHNKIDNYYLNTKTDEAGKSDFFGAIQIKKSYVAFHLMPIYYYPELLTGISQQLKSKMQGKSCFNFKVIDDSLIAELDALTKLSFDKYKELNKV